MMEEWIIPLILIGMALFWALSKLYLLYRSKHCKQVI